jgi:hypothetical protein
MARDTLMTRRLRSGRIGLFVAIVKAARNVIAAIAATYGLPRRGKSMPYARSLISTTTKKVRIVPGTPNIKANVRQSAFGLVWARMPVKLMLANTHSPEMPVSRI